MRNKCLLLSTFCTFQTPLTALTNSALYRHSTLQLFKSSIAIKFCGRKHTAQLGVLQSTPSSTASAMALKSLFRSKIPQLSFTTIRLGTFFWTHFTLKGASLVWEHLHVYQVPSMRSRDISAFDSCYI